MIILYGTRSQGFLLSCFWYAVACDIAMVIHPEIDTVTTKVLNYPLAWFQDHNGNIGVVLLDYCFGYLPRLSK